MDDYRPSRFDRFLLDIDRLIQHGFAFLTREEPFDVDQHLRHAQFVPVRVAAKPHRGIRRRTHWGLGRHF